MNIENRRHELIREFDEAQSLYLAGSLSKDEFSRKSAEVIEFRNTYLNGAPLYTTYNED